jgi:hypothetical protein
VLELPIDHWSMLSVSSGRETASGIPAAVAAHCLNDLTDAILLIGRSNAAVTLITHMSEM